MSETRRTPSATVNPNSDLLDLFARWTDLNNLTVFDVLQFVISPHVFDGLEVDMDIDVDVEAVLESPARRWVDVRDG